MNPNRCFVLLKYVVFIDTNRTLHNVVAPICINMLTVRHYNGQPYIPITRTL